MQENNRSFQAILERFSSIEMRMTEQGNRLQDMNKKIDQLISNQGDIFQTHDHRIDEITQRMIRMETANEIEKERGKKRLVISGVVVTSLFGLIIFVLEYFMKK